MRLSRAGTNPILQKSKLKFRGIQDLDPTQASKWHSTAAGAAQCTGGVVITAPPGELMAGLGGPQDAKQLQPWPVLSAPEYAFLLGLNQGGTGLTDKHLQCLTVHKTFA